MSKFYNCKGWEKFQHYKRPNPPWIKLHRALLDDYNFSQMSEKSRLHIILIWLYASQNNGKIPNNKDFLERKLDIVGLDFKEIIEAGFIDDGE
jgi:hypothetical protein